MSRICSWDDGLSYLGVRLRCLTRGAMDSLAPSLYNGTLAWSTRLSRRLSKRHTPLLDWLARRGSAGQTCSDYCRRRNMVRTLQRDRVWWSKESYMSGVWVQIFVGECVIWGSRWMWIRTILLRYECSFMHTICIIMTSILGIDLYALWSSTIEATLNLFSIQPCPPPSWVTDCWDRRQLLLLVIECRTHHSWACSNLASSLLWLNHW
jgi:hypothetical protein